MASVYRNKTRNGFYAQVWLSSGQRVALWLGPVSETDAQYVAAQLEALKVARAINVSPPPAAMAWAKGTDRRVKAKLVEWGLIPACNLASYRISTWLDEYCRQRGDVVEATRRKYRNAVTNHLLAVLPDKDIRAITTGDAQRFYRQIVGADSHKGKIVKLVKQVFAAAVADGVLEFSPFDALKGSNATDLSRDRYISADLFDRLYKKLPSPESRLCFTLTRWAGLRGQSENYALRWTDLDWERSTIAVHSQKGKRYAHRRVRVVPMFPRVRTALEAAFDEAEPGEKWILNRFRSAPNKVMTAHLNAACKELNVTPWPKLWNNLRASCRTDLEQQFPAFVCDAWLGHSERIARKHYHRVTDEHIQAAVGGTVAGTVVEGS